MNYQLIKNTEWKEKEINEENKKIPINWNVDTIGKVFKINGGGTPSTTNKEFWDGNIPWLGPKEMSKEKSAYIGIGEKNISDLGAKKLGNKKILKDSIIISTRAPVGYLKFAKNDLYTNQGCHSLLPSQMIDNQYMYYWLSKNKYILEKKSNGTTFKELSHGSLKAIEFSFPELNNQKLISSILFKQESIISNIEKLIEKNKIIFNELSEQLLSGELRLKENDGKVFFYRNPEDNLKELEINGKMKKIPNDWDKDYLGSKNIPFAKSAVEKYKGTVNYYATGEVNDFSLGEQPTGIFSYEEKPSRANVRILNNTIYFARMKNTLKILKFEKAENFILSTGFLGLQPNMEKVFLDYLYYIIISNDFQILKNKECKGATQESLSDGAAKNIEILIPKIEEQKLISNILRKQLQKNENLNSLLTNEKQKFEWLLDNLLSGNYLVKEIEK